MISKAHEQKYYGLLFLEILNLTQIFITGLKKYYLVLSGEIFIKQILFCSVCCCQMLFCLIAHMDRNSLVCINGALTLHGL